MNEDASLPPQAPVTNGTSHGEADASSAPSQPNAKPLSEVCADLDGRISRFLAATPEDETTRRTQEQTRIALNVIEKALEDYGFTSLSLSYNGGKDCLVLLILYLAQLHTFFAKAVLNHGSPTQEHSFPHSIPSIYAKPSDPFPSVTSFVASSSAQYHLDLVHIQTSSPEVPHSSRVTFRDAFEIYLNSHPDIKAIFVGTRRTDPHGKYLTHYDRTDKGWPDFMRIHPVIDWHLSEIWCFLRAKELGEADGTHLAYCSMYDEGYTSLGGVNDTSKNPKLRGGEGNYRPAYELTKDSEERLGR